MENVKYPVGKFLKPTSFSKEALVTHLSDLEQFPSSFEKIALSLSPHQLEKSYREGGWTARQVIHHVADSHLNAFIRIKLALTQENPTVMPYDENAWALTDDYTLPIDVSLRLIASIHSKMVSLLRNASEDSFSRTLFHPENGEMIVFQIVAMYAWHGRHHEGHLKIIMGKE